MWNGKQIANDKHNENFQLHIQMPSSTDLKNDIDIIVQNWLRCSNCNSYKFRHKIATFLRLVLTRSYKLVLVNFICSRQELARLQQCIQNVKHELTAQNYRCLMRYFEQWHEKTTDVTALYDRETYDAGHKVDILKCADSTLDAEQPTDAALRVFAKNIEHTNSNEGGSAEYSIDLLNENPAESRTEWQPRHTLSSFDADSMPGVQSKCQEDFQRCNNKDIIGDNNWTAEQQERIATRAGIWQDVSTHSGFNL